MHRRMRTIRGTRKAQEKHNNTESSHNNHHENNKMRNGKRKREGEDAEEEEQDIASADQLDLHMCHESQKGSLQWISGADSR